MSARIMLTSCRNYIEITPTRCGTLPHYPLTFADNGGGRSWLTHLHPIKRQNNRRFFERGQRQAYFAAGQADVLYTY